MNSRLNQATADFTGLGGRTAFSAVLRSSSSRIAAAMRCLHILKSGNTVCAHALLQRARRSMSMGASDSTTTSLKSACANTLRSQSIGAVVVGTGPRVRVGRARLRAMVWTTSGKPRALVACARTSAANGSSGLGLPTKERTLMGMCANKMSRCQVNGAQARALLSWVRGGVWRAASPRFLWVVAEFRVLVRAKNRAHAPISGVG